MYDAQERIGGYTKQEWRQMIEDNVVTPSYEVLEFIKPILSCASYMLF